MEPYKPQYLKSAITLAFLILSSTVVSIQSAEAARYQPFIRAGWNANDKTASPQAPENLTATVANVKVSLTWDTPPSEQ